MALKGALNMKICFCAPLYFCSIQPDLQRNLAPSYDTECARSLPRWHVGYFRVPLCGIIYMHWCDLPGLNTPVMLCFLRSLWRATLRPFRLTGLHQPVRILPMRRSERAIVFSSGRSHSAWGEKEDPPIWWIGWGVWGTGFGCPGDGWTLLMVAMLCSRATNVNEIVFSGLSFSPPA